jgi:hypothetical protein
MKLFRVYGYAVPEAEPEQVYFVVADDGDEAVEQPSDCKGSDVASGPQQ